MLASMLHVALDKPRNRRDVTVPGPGCFLRMAVDASMGKHICHSQGSVCAQKHWRACSVRGLAGDKMHRHGCNKPHEKKTGHKKSHVRAATQTGAPSEGCVFYYCI